MTPGDSGRNGSESETGQPLRLLLNQELEPSASFMGKIRRKIHRRTATTQLAAFSWHMPKVILIEMVGVFSHIVSAFSGRRKDS